eukprot:scaffold39032_cov70-Cyclotella_meneghiniana.AAC.2
MWRYPSTYPSTDEASAPYPGTYPRSQINRVANPGEYPPGDRRDSRSRLLFTPLTHFSPPLKRRPSLTHPKPHPPANSSCLGCRQAARSSGGVGGGTRKKTETKMTSKAFTEIKFLPEGDGIFRRVLISEI